MDRYLKASILHFAAAAIIAVWGLLLLGCDNPKHLRQDGFDSIQKAFVSYPYMDGEICVHLPNLYVTVCGPERMEALRQGFNTSPGCPAFTTGNLIYVEGRMIDGKIAPNQAHLGHELLHQMSNKDSRIINPDELF